MSQRYMQRAKRVLGDRVYMARHMARRGTLHYTTLHAERERVLGDRVRRVLGDARDAHAERGRGREVDVVKARAPVAQ